MYLKLTTHELPSLDATLDLILHKQVPLKVSILAWHLLRNQLPTKDNFEVCGIISHDNQLCVTRCGGVKTAHNLFLSSLFRFSVGSCSGVAWLFIGWSVPFTGSSYLVCLFFRRVASSAFLYAACLVCYV